MDKKILKKLISTFGMDKQIDMMIEEMSELTKALLKHRRARAKSDGKLIDDTEKNVCEEIADVKLLIEQMETIFSEELIVAVKLQKEKRVKEKLKKYEITK